MPVTPTGYSGYWQRQFNQGYSTLQKYPNVDMRVARVLRLGKGSRKLRQIITALTGSTVGASKALNRKRIKAEASTLTPVIHGGSVSIETVAELTGNTVTADLNRVDNVLAVRPRPTTYPNNASGWKPGQIGKLA